LAKAGCVNQLRDAFARSQLAGGVLFLNALFASARHNPGALLAEVFNASFSFGFRRCNGVGSHKCFSLIMITVARTGS